MCFKKHSVKLIFLNNFQREFSPGRRTIHIGEIRWMSGRWVSLGVHGRNPLLVCYKGLSFSLWAAVQEGLRDTNTHTYTYMLPMAHDSHTALELPQNTHSHTYPAKGTEYTHTHTHTHTHPANGTEFKHTSSPRTVSSRSYSSSYVCRASNNGVSDTVSKKEKKMLLRGVYLDPQHDWFC